MKRWNSGGWFNLNEPRLLAVQSAFRTIHVEIDGGTNPDLAEDVMMIYIGPEKDNEAEPTALTTSTAWATGKTKGPFPIPKSQKPSYLSQLQTKERLIVRQGGRPYKRASTRRSARNPSKCSGATSAIRGGMNPRPSTEGRYEDNGRTGSSVCTTKARYGGNRGAVNGASVPRMLPGTIYRAPTERKAVSQP